MIPSSVLGLLVIAASLGPGYAWVRVAEQRKPRPNRSALQEIAELVTVGGSCTAVVALVALAVTEWTGKVDLEALGRDGWAYALAQPVAVLTLLLAILAGSYSMAIGVSFLVHRGTKASLNHSSIWYELLSRRKDGLAPYATVELRDGRTVAGPVAFYTVQEAPPDCRELVLYDKISARSSPSAEFVSVSDDRVVLRASDMAALGVKYFDPEA